VAHSRHELRFGAALASRSLVASARQRALRNLELGQSASSGGASTHPVVGRDDAIASGRRIMRVTRVVSGYGKRRARRWLPGASAMLLIAGILPILVSDPASAASTITVTSTTDGTGNCTLRDAITSANNNSNSGGCTGAGGGGPFTIDVPAGYYDLTLGELTISGAGAGLTTVHQILQARQ
jgi:hypothetical protein